MYGTWSFYLFFFDEWWSWCLVCQWFKLICEQADRIWTNRCESHKSKTKWRVQCRSFRDTDSGHGKCWVPNYGEFACQNVECTVMCTKHIHIVHAGDRPRTTHRLRYKWLMVGGHKYATTDLVHLSIPENFHSQTKWILYALASSNSFIHSPSLVDSCLCVLVRFMFSPVQGHFLRKHVHQLLLI